MIFEMLGMVFLLFVLFIFSYYFYQELMIVVFLLNVVVLSLFVFNVGFIYDEMLKEAIQNPDVVTQLISVVVMIVVVSAVLFPFLNKYLKKVKRKKVKK
jgi:hypothetical protein